MVSIILKIVWVMLAVVGTAARISYRRFYLFKVRAPQLRAVPARIERYLARLDLWCRGDDLDEKLLPVWYSDAFAVKLLGFIGIGAEIVLITLSALLYDFELYLFLNIYLLNGIWGANILYRKYILAGNLK